MTFYTSFTWLKINFYISFPPKTKIIDVFCESQGDVFFTLELLTVFLEILIQAPTALGLQLKRWHQEVLAVLSVSSNKGTFSL